MPQNNFWQTECLRGLIFHQHNYVIETDGALCFLEEASRYAHIVQKRKEYVMSITSFHLNNTLFCFVSCSSVMSCVTVSIYLVILLSFQIPYGHYKYSDMQSIQSINREFGQITPIACIRLTAFRVVLLVAFDFCCDFYFYFKNRI